MDTRTKFPILELTNYLKNQPPEQPIRLVKLIRHFDPMATDANDNYVPMYERMNIHDNGFDLITTTLDLKFSICMDTSDNLPSDTDTISYFGQIPVCTDYCYSVPKLKKSILDYQTVKQQKLKPVTNQEYLTAFQKFYQSIGH